MAASIATERAASALRMYRHFLQLAQRMSGDQRTGALRQIREGFRSNQHEKDEGRIVSLLDSASSSLSYMRMVTPKRPGGDGAGGKTRIVYKDGEAIEGGDPGKRDKAAVSNWTGTNLDPDAVSKHTALLNRAGFRDNAHAKGFF